MHLPLLIEIHRVFDFFNERFTNNELKKPLILLSPSGDLAMFGWFGISEWKQGEEDLVEINLAAEYLDREPHAVIETLIHEMAHLMNHQRRIVDIDLESQYHNEHFKIAAQSLGLKVRKRNPKGWAYTSLGPLALQAICDLKLDTAVFGLYMRKN